MRVELEIWRQDGPTSEGRFETHVVTDATPEMSLLELLDRLNDQLAEQGLEPISFESDCREGVCGACGVTVNDVPHGPVPNTPSCRQHLRAFGGITKLRIEPLRSAAFPVVRDLVVNRAALDSIIRAGGHVDIMAGTAPDADDFLVGHEDAELALDFATFLMVPSSLLLHMVGDRETSPSTAFTELSGAPGQVKVAAGSAEVGSDGFIVCVISGVCCWGRGFKKRAPRCVIGRFGRPPGRWRG